MNPSFSIFVLGDQNDRLNETIFLAHSICFGYEIRKIIFNYACSSRGLYKIKNISC